MPHNVLPSLAIALEETSSGDQSVRDADTDEVVPLRAGDMLVLSADVSAKKDQGTCSVQASPASVPAVLTQMTPKSDADLVPECVGAEAAPREDPSWITDHVVEHVAATPEGTQGTPVLESPPARRVSPKRARKALPETPAPKGLDEIQVTDAETPGSSRKRRGSATLSGRPLAKRIRLSPPPGEEEKQAANPAWMDADDKDVVPPTPASEDPLPPPPAPAPAPVAKRASKLKRKPQGTLQAFLEPAAQEDKSAAAPMEIEAAAPQPLQSAADIVAQVADEGKEAKEGKEGQSEAGARKTRSDDARKQSPKKTAKDAAREKEREKEREQEAKAEDDKSPRKTGKESAKGKAGKGKGEKESKARSPKDAAKEKKGGARSARAADDRPCPRWGHTATPIRGGDAVVVYGGQGEGQEMVSDDVWVYECVPGTWTRHAAPEDGPGKRMGHSATLFGDALYIIGGSKHKKWLNDVWKLDLNTMTWMKPELHGTPPATAYHSATLINQEVYIFGGINGGECINALHILDLVTDNVYRPIIMGSPPTPRSGHSCVRAGQSLVVFGGWDAPDCFDDTYVLDLAFMEWAKVEVRGTPPSPRTWHAAAVLKEEKDGQRVLIYGGYDGNDAMSDMHIFNLDTRTWTPCAGALPAGTPTLRAGHTISMLSTKAAVKVGSSMAVFGGGDNADSFFNDVAPLCIQ